MQAETLTRYLNNQRGCAVLFGGGNITVIGTGAAITADDMLLVATADVGAMWCWASGQPNELTFEDGCEAASEMLLGRAVPSENSNDCVYDACLVYLVDAHAEDIAKAVCEYVRQHGGVAAYREVAGSTLTEW